MTRRFLHAAAAAAMAACLAAPALAVDTAPTGAATLEQARAAIDAGDYAGAIGALQTALQAAPGNADILNLLGYANRKAGNLDQAAQWYQAALAADPNHLGALEYQGEMFVMQGDTAAAEANLARLTELCGSCEEREDLAEALAGS